MTTIRRDSPLTPVRSFDPSLAPGSAAPTKSVASAQADAFVSGPSARMPAGNAALASQLVTAEYAKELRRAPDLDGMSMWTAAVQSQLDAGQSPDAVQAWLDSGFEKSPEYQALQLTDQAFSDLLGRDVSGSRGYWHEEAVAMMRDQGKSAAETADFVRQNLMASPEYRAHAAAQIVDDSFQSLLGRPDTDATDWWHQQVQSMVDQGASLDDIRGFVESGIKASPEYAQKNLDQEVTATFQSLLGRPDDAGDWWHQQAQAQLAQGRSLDEIKQWMTASLEGTDEYGFAHLDQVVNGLYQQLLHRDADPDGLQGFTAMARDLQAQGQSLAQVKGAITAAIQSSPEYQGKQGVTLAQLEAIMPELPDATAQEYLPYLNQAMSEAQINTPQRRAAFLAQLAEESVQLTAFEEFGSGWEYEGRADLGNIYPGDGPRYKGRGPIQLTGRANYISAGNALGIDLVDNPERAADPDVGFRTAAWFWTTHDLNAQSDAGNFLRITLAINGGTNGEAQREAYWNTARDVLGA